MCGPRARPFFPDRPRGRVIAADRPPAVFWLTMFVTRTPRRGIPRAQRPRLRHARVTPSTRRCLTLGRIPWGRPGVGHRRSRAGARPRRAISRRAILAETRFRGAFSPGSARCLRRPAPPRGVDAARRPSRAFAPDLRPPPARSPQATTPRRSSLAASLQTLAVDSENVPLSALGGRSGRTPNKRMTMGGPTMVPYRASPPGSPLVRPTNPRSKPPERDAPGPSPPPPRPPPARRRRSVRDATNARRKPRGHPSRVLGRVRSCRSVAARVGSRPRPTPSPLPRRRTEATTAPRTAPERPPSAPYPAPSGGRHTRSMGPPPPVADPHARGGRPPPARAPTAAARSQTAPATRGASARTGRRTPPRRRRRRAAGARRVSSRARGRSRRPTPDPAPAPRRRRPPSGIPPRTAPRSPTSSTPCPRRRGAAPRSPPSTPPTNPGFTTEPARRRPRRRRPPAPRTAIRSPAEANNTGANNTRGTANTTGVPPGPRRGRSGTRARRPGTAPPRGSARTRTKCFTGVRRRRRTTARGARRRR